jgi:hypothetical protein
MPSKHAARRRIITGRDIFIFDGGNKKLRNVTNLYRVIHLLPPVAKLTLKIMIPLSYFADLIYYP